MSRHLVVENAREASIANIDYKPSNNAAHLLCIARQNSSTLEVLSKPDAAANNHLEQ
jgi:hypothetical protein